MKQCLFYLLIVSITFFANCKSVARYPIDEPSTANIDDGILGRWKFEEDTNKYNFYEIVKYHTNGTYHIKFWDRNGTNPTYEANFHFSRIGNVRFINMPNFEEGFVLKGNFFLKILDVNADFSRMTTAMIHDTTMWELNQAGLKQRITRNIDNPAFYSDTVHFFKIR